LERSKTSIQRQNHAKITPPLITARRPPNKSQILSSVQYLSAHDNFCG
jgi:hypothetical protein